MVRACGSYPQCPGFESLRRYHLLKTILLSSIIFKFYFPSFYIRRFFVFLGIYALKEAVKPNLERMPLPGRIDEKRLSNNVLLGHESPVT